MKNSISSNKKFLEELFKFVDFFKDSLKNTKHLSFSENFLKTDCVLFKYDKNNMCICNKETIFLNNVTDFHFSFFKDSNSIIYRIDINNKEQVRGYLYLSNLI